MTKQEIQKVRDWAYLCLEIARDKKHPDTAATFHTANAYRDVADLCDDYLSDKETLANLISGDRS